MQFCRFIFLKKNLKQLNYLIICSILLGLFVVPEKNYSQSAVARNLYLNLGSTLNVDANAENDVLYSGYIAPSLKLGKHEIYIGGLINEQEWGIKFKPSLGGLLGYKFYIDKNANPIQFFLNYCMIIQRYLIYDDYWSYNSEIFTIKQRFYNNVVGYGLNFYLNKKRNFYFYQTTGYSIMLEKDKDYLNSNYDHKDHQFYWSQLMFTVGMTCKLTSFKNKN